MVVPAYNEEENLLVLIPKLLKVLEGLGGSFEMIFVDDGSSDGSRRILREMALQHPSLRVLRFRENRGLSTALVAGMREARGEKSVTLDSDLQSDPADILKLLEYLDRYDMATGWRQKREDTWLKRISSKIGNAVRNWVSARTSRAAPAPSGHSRKNALKRSLCLMGCTASFPPWLRGQVIGSLKFRFSTIRGSLGSRNTMSETAWYDPSSIYWR